MDEVQGAYRLGQLDNNEKFLLFTTKYLSHLFVVLLYGMFFNILGSLYDVDFLHDVGHIVTGFSLGGFILLLLLAKFGRNQVMGISEELDDD